MAKTFYVMDALGWFPGFFCSFQSVIGFLNFCESRPSDEFAGMKVFFEKGLYFDESIGPNWWEYYFEPISVGEITADTLVEHVGDMIKSQWGTDAISVISRERASQIIKKYIKVKPHIQNKIDAVCKCLEGHYIVGVHYRGTDKSSEALRVDYSKVKEAIEFRNHKDCKIFVATDEHEFIKYMKKEFGNKVVCIDAIRSSDHEPIHHVGGNLMENRYRLGEEAVMDCYLLSKANLLIKTQSNLSSSAANINPLLEVVSLNQPYRVGLR